MWALRSDAHEYFHHVAPSEQKENVSFPYMMLVREKALGCNSKLLSVADLWGREETLMLIRMPVLNFGILDKKHFQD